jgi:thiamine pyrophosphate-dependent acetolactate synthase large subunit-like protein
MESILMKTYDVVAAAIEAQETGHCFALLGDGNMHFAGALYLCTA